MAGNSNKQLYSTILSFVKNPNTKSGFDDFIYVDIAIARSEMKVLILSS